MASSEVTTAPVASPTTRAAPAEGGAGRTALELTLLGAIWGGSFLFMRVAAGDFGPIPLVEARLALGALVLLPFLWRARAQFTPRLWLRIAGIAAINSVIPFALFAWGAERAPAGIGAITNAMTVMFTALVAFLFYGERIGARRLIGLAAGFVGVAVLASGKTAGASVVAGRARGHRGVAAATASASTSCAATSPGCRRRRSPPPTCSPAACCSRRWRCTPGRSTPSRARPGAARCCSGCCAPASPSSIYYRLIARIGAPRTSTVTYLIPLFGVIWAWLLLGEPLTLTMALAGALILAGVALSQQRQRKA